MKWTLEEVAKHATIPYLKGSGQSWMRSPHYAHTKARCSLYVRNLAFSNPLGLRCLEKGVF